MAFKMKGFSGFKNVSKTKYGEASAAFQKTGDPEKEMTQEEKDAAIANAMPTAEVERLSDTTMAGMKKYFGGVNADYDQVRTKLRAALNRGDNNYQEMRKIVKARYPKLARNL